MADVENTPQADAEVAAKPKSGLASLIKVGGFIVIVVVGECLLAWMYGPGAGPAVAKAESKSAKSAKEAAEPKDEGDKDEAGEEKEQAEVDLGEFRVTSYRPESNTTWYIDFHLYGAVEAAKQSDFDARFEKHKHRLRDQVLVIIRSMNRNDLADPGLGLIKRQILEKTNRTVGKTLLRSVVFSEFSFQEQ